MEKEPKLEDIEAAALRIKKHTHQTPVFTSRSLDKIFGCSLFFKCENLQKAGAFKFRGACNAVFSLDSNEIKRGVATHSSGNHAAALSLAARLRNSKAYIVMPHTAPLIKKSAVKEYGAEIVLCEPTLKSREETLIEVVKETGAVFIHPYDNYTIIAGQGTAAKEFLDEVPALDYLITPLGGGGILCGSAITAHYISPKTKVIGVEPKGADDAYRSLRDNKIYPSINPHTIADGLLTQLCDKTFSIIKKFVGEILTVDEESIVSGMKIVWERMKIIIEPSSAVVIAAVMENERKFSGKRVGVILTGGNVDLENLPWS